MNVNGKMALNKVRNITWSLIFAQLFLLVRIWAAPSTSVCPSHCTCVINPDGLQTASCVANIQWNGIAYHNIHTVSLILTDMHVKCEIPDDLSLIFPQLNFLKLKNCRLSVIPSNKICKLKLLQELDLSHNQIRKLSPSLFDANTKLHYVNLENNPLDIDSHPFLLSNSIWEINLNSCEISHLSASIFDGLPNLKYLNLANNKLKFIEKNVLPESLKTINLSGNKITNIPLVELNRLRRLKEIDLSHNPIDCSCKLLDIQNWAIRKGAIFRNEIQCASPIKYVGWSISSMLQNEICDPKAQAITKQHTISNQIWVSDDYIMDQPSQPMLGDTNDDGLIFDSKLKNIVGKNAVEGSGDMLMDGSGDDEVGNDTISEVKKPLFVYKVSPSDTALTTENREEEFEGRFTSQPSLPSVLLSTNINEKNIENDTTYKTVPSESLNGKSDASMQPLKVDNIYKTSLPDTIITGTIISNIVADPRNFSTTVDSIISSTAINEKTSTAMVNIGPSSTMMMTMTTTPLTDLGTFSVISDSTTSLLTGNVKTSSMAANIGTFPMTTMITTQMTTPNITPDSKNLSTITNSVISSSTINVESSSMAVSTLTNGTRTTTGDLFDKQITYDDATFLSVNDSHSSSKETEDITRNKNSTVEQSTTATSTSNPSDSESKLGKTESMTLENETEIKLQTTVTSIKTELTDQEISPSSMTEGKSTNEFIATETENNNNVIKTTNLPPPIDGGDLTTNITKTAATITMVKNASNLRRNNETTHSLVSKNQDSMGYVIPTLLIIAVVFICFSVYFSHHNCHLKSWNQSDPKSNNTTELQDVNLLPTGPQVETTDRYSKKYQTKGSDSSQTEKLMNGDSNQSADENIGVLCEA